MEVVSKGKIELKEGIKYCEHYQKIFFRDSLLILGHQSLSNLIKNLRYEVDNGEKTVSEQFSHLYQYFYRHGYLKFIDERFLTSKNFFPYMEWRSPDFLELQELPLQQFWKDSYPPNGISDEDYKFATDVFDQLCKYANEHNIEPNLDLYLSFYLLIDTFSLASILQSIARDYFHSYGVCILQYDTAAQYSWNIFCERVKVPSHCI